MYVQRLLVTKFGKKPSYVGNLSSTTTNSLAHKPIIHQHLCDSQATIMHQRYHCCRHWVAARENGRRWQRLFFGDEKEGARKTTKVLLEKKTQSHHMQTEKKGPDWSRPQLLGFSWWCFINIGLCSMNYIQIWLGPFVLSRMIASSPASQIWTNQTLVSGRPVLGRGEPPVKFPKY